MANTKNFDKSKMNFKISRIISYLGLYGTFGVFNFIYLRSYILLIALIIFALLPFISFHFLRILNQNITLDLFRSDEYITSGNDIGIGVFVNNLSFFSSLKLVCEILISNPYYNEKSFQKLSLPVAAKAQNTSTLTFKTQNSGLIHILITNYEIYDLLGMFSYTVNPKCNTSINILPSVSPLSGIQQYGIANGLSQNEDETKTGNEFSDTSNIREYIPGDRLKDIHWKLSSKRQIMLVREHIKICEDKLMLWMDYSTNKTENEKILQFAYSVCNYCISEGIFLNILWCTSDNHLSNYTINSKDELHSAISDMFLTIKHDKNFIPKDLLINNNIKATQIIRIKASNGEVNLDIYEV